MLPPSRLLTLPAEVRLLVYVHLFAGTTLRPRYQVRLRSASNPQPAAKTTAVLATCHLCHAEALPVFFQTCQFKLMTAADKHAFLSSVPASQYASVHHLILNTPKVLYDWSPRFVARNFPALKTVEVPFFEVWSRERASTQIVVEDSDKCAVMVQENLTRLADRFVAGHRTNMIGNAISSHTTEERRSYAIILRTVLNFAFPSGIRYVVGRLLDNHRHKD